MAEYRVNVYESYEDYEHGGDIIGRVRYNADLDYWDGRNWTNGGVGRHKGITKLKDGRYVIIRGTDWQGEKDYAYCVTEDEALKEILKAGKADLLKTKKYSDLYKIMKKLDDMEIEE